MSQTNPKYVYDRLRALLGGALPSANFKAAQALIELSGPEIRTYFETAIGAVSPAAVQVMSAYGKAILKQLEGLRTKAYRDIAGVPTIGFGNTFHPDGRPVKMGDVITVAQADEYLSAILPKYETAVRKIVTAPLRQHEFDALVCFVYNIGATAFLNGGVDDALNRGDKKGALELWAKYRNARNPATGKLEKSAGLVNRRNAEIALFNKA